MHIYIYDAYLHVYVHVYTHIHMHMHIHMHIHTHAHAHTYLFHIPGRPSGGKVNLRLAIRNRLHFLNCVLIGVERGAPVDHLIQNASKRPNITLPP